MIQKDLSTVPMAILLGGVAGAIALAVDLALAWMLTGFGDRLAAVHLAAYVLTGSAGGLLAWLILLARRRRSATRKLESAWLFVGGLVAVPVMAFVARIWSMWGSAMPMRLALVAGILMALGIGGLLIGWWIRHAAGGFLWLAVGLTVALSLNRFLVGHWFETRSLGVNAVVLTVWGLAIWLSRRRQVRTLSALLLVTSLAFLAMSLRPYTGSVPLRAGSESRPNLLLLVIDTLRLDVFQSVLDETPEGERLRQALRGAAHFSNAVATSSWTAPSMGSMLTGLHPQHHGLVKTGTGGSDGWSYRRLAPHAVPVAEHLSDAGYHCEALVANAMLNSGTGIDRGFAHFEQLRGPTRRLPLLVALSRLEWLPPRPYQPADDVRRRFVDRLPSLERQAPFFAWLHFMDPHHPLFDHDELETEPGESSMEPMRRLYRRETRFTLREVAKVLEALETRGLDENTWVIVVSDHGEMLPGDRPPEDDIRHGHGHALYEPLVHVPLIIRPPGGWSEDRHIDAVASHVDLFPTVLRLLDVQPAQVPEGPDAPQSLTPWLEPQPAPPASESYALSGTHHFHEPQRSLRGDRWKLIQWLEQGRTSLYDVQQDAGEARDLAKEHPDVVKDLSSQLEKQWRRLAKAEPSEPTPLDEETLRQLEALGYVN